MFLTRSVAASLSVLGLLFPAIARCEAQPVAWSERGSYRLLVKVAPLDLAGRHVDELPADVAIDWATLGEVPDDRVVDIASLQVVRYDEQTGKPIRDAVAGKGNRDLGRPFRWYDGSIPYEFPEVVEDVSRTGGELRRKPKIRGGYFFNALGDWKRGRLTWLHTQQDTTASFYAVYFDLLPRGARPDRVPPRSWIGDGLARCDQRGTTTTGADHSRIDVDDWNGDGLVDIIAGEQYGHLFVWPNRGTKTKPEFPYCKFLFDVDGLPIDAGSAAAPKVADWNGDGVKDLLIGAEWNRILLFLNMGTNADRQLKYSGLLTADGDTLMLPIKPLVRGSEEVFKRDYYPVLETVDWDDDGDIDLLAGGYITGRVYFYENQGTGSDGLPALSLVGPIEADGKPLNVGHWCASPCVADFDGDGDLDLMSGCMPMTGLGGDGDASATSMLRYYENQGARSAALFRAKTFPALGALPRASLATPRAADWNGDGLLDLVVSARSDLYLLENRGTANEPRFVSSGSLASRWGSARIPADQFLDWNGDGRLDLFVRGHYAIRLNTGRGNPWSWGEEIPILAPGERIAHPSGIGDDWFWPLLDDFDQDGRMDILFGDWHGQIWFHRNLSEKDPATFDTKGVRIRLTDGNLLKVGPIDKDLSSDFNALQGARTTFTVADFDRDGRRDLIVGDTYGKVRYFRQANDAETESMVFEAPRLLGDLGIRLLVDATDWNGDGWEDVIAGAANGRVRVFLNSGNSGSPRFQEGFDPGLPPIAQPRVLMADLNGDGDEDLYLPSTQGSCFVERSFLKHGYAAGTIIAVEGR